MGKPTSFEPVRWGSSKFDEYDINVLNRPEVIVFRPPQKTRGPKSGLRDVVVIRSREDQGKPGTVQAKDYYDVYVLNEQNHPNVVFSQSIPESSSLKQRTKDYGERLRNPDKHFVTIVGPDGSTKQIKTDTFRGLTYAEATHALAAIGNEIARGKEGEFTVTEDNALRYDFGNGSYTVSGLNNVDDAQKIANLYVGGGHVFQYPFGQTTIEAGIRDINSAVLDKEVPGFYGSFENQINLESWNFTTSGRAERGYNDEVAKFQNNYSGTAGINYKVPWGNVGISAGAENVYLKSLNKMDVSYNAEASGQFVYNDNFSATTSLKVENYFNEEAMRRKNTYSSQFAVRYNNEDNGSEFAGTVGFRELENISRNKMPKIDVSVSGGGVVDNMYVGASLELNELFKGDGGWNKNMGGSVMGILGYEKNGFSIYGGLGASWGSGGLNTSWQVGIGYTFHPGRN